MLLRKGYSDADSAGGVVNTPSTVFRIGGLSKPLTAAGILLLESQGRLSVDDPICDYVDDCPAAWVSVPLHHLLSNTSGIASYAAPDVAARYTPKELLAAVRDTPLRFAPGAEFELSQTNYALLGMVIERVSGQPYDSFMQEQVFEPLGMDATGLAAAPAGLAKGYQGRRARGRL